MHAEPMHANSCRYHHHTVYRLYGNFYSVRPAADELIAEAVYMQHSSNVTKQQKCAVYAACRPVLSESAGVHGRFTT